MALEDRVEAEIERVVAIPNISFEAEDCGSIVGSARKNMQVDAVGPDVSATVYEEKGAFKLDHLPPGTYKVILRDADSDFDAGRAGVTVTASIA